VFGNQWVGVGTVGFLNPPTNAHQDREEDIETPFSEKSSQTSFGIGRTGYIDEGTLSAPCKM